MLFMFQLDAGCFTQQAYWNYEQLAHHWPKEWTSGKCAAGELRLLELNILSGIATTTLSVTSEIHVQSPKRDNLLFSKKSEIPIPHCYLAKRNAKRWGKRIQMFIAAIRQSFLSGMSFLASTTVSVITKMKTIIKKCNELPTNAWEINQKMMKCIFIFISLCYITSQRPTGSLISIIIKLEL